MRFSHPKPEILRQAYSLMRAHYDHQHWWPGETPFEVCVGAILTQNTHWGNVEKAIRNLRQARVLNPHALYGLNEPELAELIRPAGYYHIKAKRLRSFLKVLVGEHGGDLDRLLGGAPAPPAHIRRGGKPNVINEASNAARALAAARENLLSIKGIGPETADSMLLYAGRQLSFVVDAYTRRIFARHGWCAPEVDYHDLQALCAEALKNGATDLLDYWQDYHAQLVNVGKDFCRSREARCAQCPLRPLLPNGKLLSP